MGNCGSWRPTGAGSLYRRGSETYALSPDKTAVMALVPSAAVSDTPVWRWKAEVNVAVAAERRLWLWGASIDETAPSEAIAGFVTALTDPAPLLRDEGQEPSGAFHRTATRSAVSPEQLVQMRRQRLEVARRAMPPPARPALDPRASTATEAPLAGQPTRPNRLTTRFTQGR
ncbi:DUF317 domain-containing protein [Streptomyces sp. NPDC047061]|uniref:DUF317 domain-containing protein n=1 Tax=Streptomyces sp. NPDC047061 TaxID=3154605 RepID=UPI0033E11B38